MPTRHAMRLALAILACTVAVIWLDTSGTLSGFSIGKVASTASAKVASLSISNSQGGSGCAATAASPSTTTSCTSSVYPASTTAGTNSQTNTVTNTGTVPSGSMTAKYRIAGCGAVDLANSGTNGPMLVRSGTTLSPTSGPFPGAGSVSLASSSYAASVTATSEPTGPTLVGSATYGIGVWFKTSSTNVSPLFGFSANSATGSGSTDRILYLDTSGRIGFIPATASTTAATKSSGAFNNGSWHFAWVSITATQVALGLSFTYAVYVDGSKVASDTSGLLGTLSSYSGYWHLGWANVGGASSFFTGSLSGFTVDDSGSAPASVSANPTAYSWDPTATQLWQLNDSGGSFDGASTLGGIYTGTNPSGVDPCSLVGITWTLTNPTQTVTIGASPTLAGMAAANYQTMTAPGATAQTETITLTRSATAGSYAVGLVLYAPVQATYASGTAWSVSFTWNAPAAGSVTGSTVVIS